MIPDDRVEAIRAFGYSAREAAFLVTAMLHGGFFVGRQFNQFIGQSTSRAVAHLAAKLGARRHVTVIASRGGPHVYHLRSKQLYAAVSESEARKRHRPSLLTIKTSLMALDYVLSHSDEVFLTTERELAYRACIPGIDEIKRFPAQYRGPIGFRDGSDSEVQNKRSFQQRPELPVLVFGVRTVPRTRMILFPDYLHSPSGVISRRLNNKP